MGLGLCLGLGRMQLSYERGATEVAGCEVGCARVGVPARDTWLHVQNEIPGACAEKNVLCCLFLSSYLER